ncbi:MAG: tetratricopeptide repeat protein, partial [Bacteroidota bacterium]
MSSRLAVLLFFAGTSISLAQNSLYFTENEGLYREGLDLLDKSNYAAAREMFERYIFSNGSKPNLLEAQYYAAISALTLYHKDGEKLIEEFIAENKTHPKAVLAYFELGNYYFQQKKYTKAIGYFEKVNQALVTEEERAEIRYKLGYSYFTKRKFNKALENFNLLKREPGVYGYASAYYAGYIEYENGEYDKAINDLERARKSDSYASVVPSMLANLYYKQQRYDDLISYSESVLKGSRRVNTREFYLLTADAYLNKGDNAKAAEYYTLYGEQVKNPKPEIGYRIGYANYRLGNFDEAIKNLKRAASDRDSIGIYASYYLGILYLKEGNKLYALTAFDNARKSEINKVLTEESAYQYAKVSYDLGRSEEAIEALTSFVKDYPDSNHFDEVNDLLSEAYLNTNNYQLALDHIESLDFVNSSMQEVYQKAAYLKGAELFNKGRYPQAITSFGKSLKYTPDARYKAMTNLWAAESYSIGKRYDQAIDNYKLVITNTAAKGNIESIRARYGLGYAYYNTKQYDKALIHFKEYVNLLEGAQDKQYYDDALLRLADCYYVSKLYENALEYYNKAVRYNKIDNDYAHLQAGIVMGIQGNVSGAVNEYNYVVKNYPKSRYMDDALFQKGQLYLEKGNYEAAVTGFTQLIDKKPSSRFVPYGYMRRASSYYNLQKYNEAISDYQVVLKEFITHSAASEALLPLQEVLNVQGRSQEFDAILKNYKTSNPDKKGLEAVDFESAKNQYFNLNYKQAITSFERYIDQYPNDARVNEARYYIGESYYRMQEFENALDYYNELMSVAGFAQRNRVVGRIGEIEFRSGRYENANYFYYQLADIAATK